MEHDIAIGVDIGGSHISCAAVDLKDYRIFRETLTERAVDNKAEAGEILGIWAEALSGAIEKVPGHKIKGIGFGMPGPFDYVKGISYIKLLKREALQPIPGGIDFTLKFHGMNFRMPYI